MASEIIVSINVKSGKAEVSLNKAKASVDSLAKAKEKLAHAETELAKDIALVNLKTKEQIQVNNQAAAATLKNVNKGSGQFRTQVGLNNAILTEAGRAASDLRFGFNGVANNVGQMASLFGSLINTSDNMATSMKNLFKSLAGTGGVMIAIQLLIAYGDQIYKFFTDAANNAGILTEAFEDAAKGISSTVGNFEIYIRTLQDSTKSNEEHKDAMHQLNEEFPDFIASLKESDISLQDITDGTEAATLATDLYRKSIEKLALSEAARAKITEMQSKALQIQLDRDTRARENGFEDYEHVLRVTNEVQEKSNDIIAKSQTANSTYVDTVLEKAKDIKGMRQDELDDIETNTKILLGYVDIVIDLDKKTGKSLSNRVRIFREKTLQLEKLEQKYREQAINKDGLTNEERTAQFEENELAKLDIIIKNFIEREELRLKNYKESVAKLKISNKKKAELIADAEAKFTNEIKIAGEDRLKVQEQIEAAGDLRLLRLLLKEQQIRRKFDLIKTESLKTSLGDDEAYFTARAAVFKDNILAQEELVESYAEGTSERANAEIELFRLQDALRNNDLEKEKAFIENKKSINSEYVGFAQGISKLLGTIAGENEDMRKASLLIEKGAAIADIVIKTQAANAITVAQDTASLGATIPITTPLRIRNNISAGISIANILATTIASFKKPSTGGGASSGGGRIVNAPDFNVVGASETNQLSQTVAATSNRIPVINLSVNEIDDKINENTASVEYSGF